MLEVGYQRILYYHHKNGAFSAFGISEKNSSTWLTAYVALSLRPATVYIQVDEEVIGSALRYITSLQESDGSFPEVGDAFAKHDDYALTLTAFTTLALIENLVGTNFL